MPSESAWEIFPLASHVAESNKTRKEVKPPSTLRGCTGAKEGMRAGVSGSDNRKVGQDLPRACCFDQGGSMASESIL